MEPTPKFTLGAKTQESPSLPVALVTAFCIRVLGFQDPEEVDLYFEYEGKAVLRAVLDAARLVFQILELRNVITQPVTVDMMVAFMESYFRNAPLGCCDPMVVQALTIPVPVRGPLRTLTDLLNPFKT